MKLAVVRLLVLLGSAASLPPKAPPGRLCWRENRKLRWGDFQAKTSAFATDSSTDAHAFLQLIVTGLVDSCGRHNFSVWPVFYPQQAWVRDSATSTAKLLAHEQLHFDLCELAARRIRARIAQVYATGADVFAVKFSQQIPRLIAAGEALQQTYDQETGHGLYQEQQATWQARVNRELADLSRYKSTASTCYAE